MDETTRTHRKISQEMIEKAEKTSIVDFALANGLKLEKNNGQEYQLADNRSLKINAQDNLYNDFALPTGTRFKGGNVINFSRLIFGYSFPEAVENVLETETAGQFDYTKIQKQAFDSKESFRYRSGMVSDRFDTAEKYLTNERGLAPDIVQDFHHKGLLEQTKHGEVLFNWKNHFEFMEPIVGGTIQGTKPLKEPVNPKRPYKKMVLKNSTSAHGFNFQDIEKNEVPDVSQEKVFQGFDFSMVQKENLEKQEKLDTIVFSESTIDLASYYQLSREHGLEKNRHYQSMEGLKPIVVKKTLELFEAAYNKKPSEVIFAIDNDRAAMEFFAGRKAQTEKEKDVPGIKDLPELEGIRVRAHIPTVAEGKDWNAILQKRVQTKHKEQTKAHDAKKQVVQPPMAQKTAGISM